MNQHTPRLKRGMSLAEILFLTLSSTTPASSVFIIVPGVLAVSGSGAFLSMLLGALVGVAMAFVYAELGSAYALSGGEYAIVGRVIGPFVGFIVMGVNLASLVLIPTVMALGMSVYLTALDPRLTVIPTAIGTIVLATAISILNVRVNALVTGVFLLVEMLALAIVTGLGLLHVSRPISDLVLHPVFFDSAKAALETTPLAMMGMATSIAMFAYNGYGTAVYFGEETRNAGQHIARAILWALAITVVAEIVPVAAILMGTADLKVFLSSANMFGEFVGTRGGARINTMVSLGIALAIFNAVIAMQLQSGRNLFSTGRDAVWPGVICRALTRTHRRFYSPWVASCVCGALAVLACFANEHLLLVVTGTGIIVVYGLLCLATLVGRRTGATSHGKYRMPLFPLAPVLGLLVLAYVTYTNWLDSAVGRPSLLTTLAVVVVSATYYLLVIRRRGAWVLQAPVD